MSTSREVGSLTAHDIGKPVRVEWEGWIHTGTLYCAHHGTIVREPNTYIGVRGESGATWSNHLPVDHVIEMQETP